MPNGYRLQVSLLGSFKIRVQSKEIRLDAWKSKKALALVKYLCANHDTRISSDALIELLWPDNEGVDCTHNLHTTIYMLRKMLPNSSTHNGKNTSCVRYSNDLYWLETEPTDWFDVDELVRCASESQRLQESDPEKALAACREGIALYKGDFMQDDLYEDWAVAQREYFREAYVEMMLRLADLLGRCHQDYTEAAKVCRIALNKEPYREDIYQMIISNLIRAGRHSDAMKQYRRCVHMLKEEFDLEPSVETMALISHLKSRSTPQGNGRGSHQLGKSVICDRETFETILGNKELRQTIRTQNVSLLTITIDDSSVTTSIPLIELLLIRCLRKTDIICRWSNKQFAVLLRQAPKEDTESVIARLKATLDQHGEFSLTHQVIDCTDFEGRADVTAFPKLNTSINN